MDNREDSLDISKVELQVLGVVKSEPVKVTKEQILEHFPEKSKTVTDELITLINQAQEDPQFDVLTMFDQMISYKDVMYNNSGSMTDYVNAIKFCSYLEVCDDNYTQAYIRTFSYRDAVKSRMHMPTSSKEYKELTSMASQYRKTSMVISILTISDAPLRLLTRGLQFKALKVLGDEMVSAYHSKDRIAAADKLLVHTRAQDEKNNKVEINIGMGAEATKQHNNILNQLHEIALQQKALLDSGVDIGQVQRLGIRREEYIEDGEIE
jgi:uncharacterized protein YrzB (UPF0473 family)